MLFLDLSNKKIEIREILNLRNMYAYKNFISTLFEEKVKPLKLVSVKNKKKSITILCITKIFSVHRVA